MVFESLRRPTGPSLELMIGQVAEMVGRSRHMFDAAMSELLAGADTDELGPGIYANDREINALEQQIRRELLVHTSIHGTTDIAGVMVLLMVSRKVERVGDNAKNIHDLATHGVQLQHGPDSDVLRGARDEVSQMMLDAAEIFRTEDEGRAPGLLARSRELQRTYEEAVVALVQERSGSADDVARALLYRYLKRIVANLEGVVAGVVQPLDLIDYELDATEADET